MGLNATAAAIHRRMCEDDRFGYSWEERYGATPETWEVGGKHYSVKVGDYDCSSSTITAWATALVGTAWEGALGGATYTGNMRAVFCASGLFEWKPASFAAVRGDLYLNEANHVAMCQGDGLLSEFSWGDNGAYGNVRGDQSGGEASVHGYYSYPWDGVLHYVGADSDSGEEAEVITEDDCKRIADQVWRYVLKGAHSKDKDAGQRLVQAAESASNTDDCGSGVKAVAGTDIRTDVKWNAIRTMRIEEKLEALAKRLDAIEKKI